MDYKKLVGDYSKINIDINNINNILIADNINYIDYLDKRIVDTAEGMAKNPLNSKLISIEIDNNGIRYNLNKLKIEACEHYGISYYPEFIIDNIDDKIDDLKESEMDVERELRTRYYKFYEDKLNDIRGNIKGLNKFKKLFLEENDITIDEEIIDENRLSLYIAYDMVLENFKNMKKGTRSYNKAKKYLEDFIINNGNNFKNYSIRDQVKIRKLITYLQDINNKDNTVDSYEVKKYKHTFFEADDTITKENYHRMCNYGLCGDNSEKLKLLLKRKMDFYETLDYKELLIGKASYSGYIGFKLDNGMVILDKFFDNVKKAKIASDNAIYVINNEEDFEMITKMSKTKTIEAMKAGLIDAYRIVHNGDYESRINDYIKIVSRKKLVKKK